MSYKLCEGVSIEHVDGQNILITDKGDAAILNETADCIVNILLNETDDEIVTQKVSDIYQIDINTVNKDVEKLIHGLVEKELIEII